MSVASEITRLQNAKASLKTSINAKTDQQHQITTETLDNYANFVDSITIGGSKLPTEYIAVNYIQSSGTQYIDTNYKINANTKFHIKCSQYRTAGGQIFGARENDFWYNLYSRSGKVAFGYNSTRVDFNISTGDYVFEDFTADSTSVVINNEVHNDITINQFPDYTLYLFAANTNGTPTEFSKSRIGRVKIYENEVLIRDYVACRRISDSMLGLYDVINNVFYVNQGSSSFSSGGDIIYNY